MSAGPGVLQRGEYSAVFNVGHNFSIFVKLLQSLNIMTCKSGLFELFATAMFLLLN